MERGWFIIKNKYLLSISKKKNKNCIISENSLIKILILEINEKIIYFFSDI